MSVLLVLGAVFVLSSTLWFTKMYAEYKLRKPNERARLEKWEEKMFNTVRIAGFERHYEQLVLDSVSYRVVIDIPKGPVRGVMTMLHGAQGTKDDPVFQHISSIASLYGIAIVRFDAQSGIANAKDTNVSFTVSSALQDIARIQSWLQTQLWIPKSAPRILFGHSAGALAAGMYASQASTEEVAGLLFLAPTISGARYVQQFEMVDPEGLQLWRKQGTRPIMHPLLKKYYTIDYSFVEDSQQYDLCAALQGTSLPIGVIAGEIDTVSGGNVAHTLRTCTGAIAYTSIAIPHLAHIPESMQSVRAIGETVEAMLEAFFASNATRFGDYTAHK